MFTIHWCSHTHTHTPRHTYWYWSWTSVLNFSLDGSQTACMNSLVKTPTITHGIIIYMNNQHLHFVLMCCRTITINVVNAAAAAAATLFFNSLHAQNEKVNASRREIENIYLDGISTAVINISKQWTGRVHTHTHKMCERDLNMIYAVKILWSIQCMSHWIFIIAIKSKKFGP